MGHSNQSSDPPPGQTAPEAVSPFLDSREDHSGAQTNLASSSAPQSAARFSALAGLIPDGILVLDASNRILALNDRFLDLFGLPADLACPNGLEDLRERLGICFGSPQDFNSLWLALNRPVPGQHPPGEWEILHPVRRILKVYQAPVTGGPADPGEGERIILWRDVTEARNLHAALQQAHKMEALGVLAGGIAHNFNNLLTAINGNLGLAIQQLHHGPLSEVAVLLADAFKAASGGRELVKQLLCHARTGVHAIQSTDLRSIVTDVRDLLRHSIPPLIVVELQLPLHLWPAMADRNEVHQVLMNLCVNAVDALKGRTNSFIQIAASNHTRISPHGTATPPPAGGHSKSDYVCIQVRDNGPGIPAEVMTRLFEPFFTTKPPGEGTGLGLAMSRDIVEKLGGWMDCESTPGKGTVFSVFLPRGADADNPPGSSSPPAALVPPSHAAPRTEVILVVDDDPLVRAVSTRLLSGAGYCVYTACDGQEAVDWMKSPQNKAHLVLLDVAMPRLSGPDAMVEIRKIRPGLPVVLCSGFLFDPAAFRDAHGMLPDASLYKPYEVGELTGTVRSVLDKHLGPMAALPS